MSGRFLEKGIDTIHTGILYVEDLSVNFDGFQAINKLSLTIDVGELRCVIGPNGAGKTTLMDVITGKTRSNIAGIEGSVYLGSTIDLMTMNEPQIAQIGIGRKFQKPTVFEQHPVWENLELAMAGDKSWHHSLVAKVDLEGRRLMEAVLALTQLESEAYREAGLLSHGQKQRLEIGMLLMQLRSKQCNDASQCKTINHYISRRNNYLIKSTVYTIKRENRYESFTQHIDCRETDKLSFIYVVLRHFTSHFKSKSFGSD